MYRDFPDLKRGDLVSVERGGVIYTDTLTGFTHHSAQPAIWPHLPLWRRITRRLTPPRWRKPLQPTQPAKPATVTITVGDDQAAINQAHKTIGQINDMAQQLAGPVCIDCGHLMPTKYDHHKTCNCTTCDVPN